MDKLKVLSFLNTDFFEVIRKADEAEVLTNFGSKIGKMLINQAILEEKFQTVCVEDGVKMTPLDDEFINDEARQCALDTKANIKKLIRFFTEKENMLKLKAYQCNSSEFSAFYDSFGNMQKLYGNKLNTPLEEKRSIETNKELLNTKIAKLQGLQTNKKDAYDKYCEECSKSKEIRDNQIKILKEQVINEN